MCLECRERIFCEPHINCLLYCDMEVKETESVCYQHLINHWILTIVLEQRTILFYANHCLQQ